MNHRRFRAGRRALVLAALCAGLSARAGGSATRSGPAPGAGDSAARAIYQVDLNDIIQPVSAGYVTAAIDRADRDGAGLVLIRLRTPGGLDTAMRQIIEKILNSRTPVAVFVGPSGARAASAGFLITIAADVAAMAPGTNIGAAHPVGGVGEKIDEVMSKKITSDAAAYIRSIATGRHRNTELAEKAITESRSYTEQEALHATPPLIDLIARDERDLLAQLDGRTVTKFDGRSVPLHTRGATILTIPMTWRERVLSAIAHPNVAYILLSLGTLGITIELWSPGAIVPGVVGGISLLLAFFAFQVLPVNYVGLLLILLGLTLLVLEVKVTSYGLLTVGGLTALFFGSMILFDTPYAEMRVSLGVIVPIVLSLGGILTFLVRLAVKAQRQRPVTGDTGMQGQIGRAITDVANEGKVFVRGEIWDAAATEPIARGTPVRVLAVDGLTLKVERV